MVLGMVLFSIACIMIVVMVFIYYELRSLRVAIEKIAHVVEEGSGDHHKEGSLANFAWILQRLVKGLEDYINHQWHATH